jgi:hypothetical protein
MEQGTNTVERVDNAEKDMSYKKMRTKLKELLEVRNIMLGNLLGNEDSQ